MLTSQQLNHHTPTQQETRWTPIRGARFSPTELLPTDSKRLRAPPPRLCFAQPVLPQEDRVRRTELEAELKNG